MSIISFRAPIAISAAGIAAAGAALVTLSPIAHADDQWKACAAPASTGPEGDLYEEPVARPGHGRKSRAGRVQLPVARLPALQRVGQLHRLRRDR